MKNDSVLKKEFKHRDVERLRNLVQGKYGDKTTMGTGYSKAKEFHNEGDVWEEDGRTWTIKNGIKQNITKLDIKSGVEGKMVIDVTTKDSSAASLASKIKDIATRNKVTTITKDKPTLKAVKENQDDLMKKIKSSLTYQVTGGKKGEPMSANEKLPANTKMTKTKLTEIIKNFNK